MDLQQSLRYKRYIESLAWQVITMDGMNIFIKHIFLYGGLAKIQRPEKLPNTEKLIPLLKQHHINSVAIEPTADTDQDQLDQFIQSLSVHFRIHTSAFLPTKTLLIDLTPSEEQLFHSLTEAKRRAVRRAEKNNVLIEESHEIQSLISIKNTSAGFLGFITTHGVKELWSTFAPDHATILLAKKDVIARNEETKQSFKPIGGVLLLFHDDMAYYWIAGATREGKKLFAPTLLVWEAMLLAKKRGARQFDFVGVWDNRLPNDNTAWKGFTKFKEGFGGKELLYPIARLRK